MAVSSYVAPLATAARPVTSSVSGRPGRPAATARFPLAPLHVTLQRLIKSELPPHISAQGLSEEQKKELKESKTFFQKLKDIFERLRKKRFLKRTSQTKKKHLDEDIDSKSDESTSRSGTLAESSTASAASVEVFEEPFKEGKKKNRKSAETEALYTDLQEKSTDICSCRHKESADETKSQKDSSYSDSIEHEQPSLGTTSEFGLSGHTKLSPEESIAGTETDIIDEEGSSEDQESEVEDSKTIFKRVKSAINGLTQRKSRKKTQKTDDDFHTSSESKGKESPSTSITSTDIYSVFAEPITEGGKEEGMSEESAALSADASSKPFSKLKERLKKKSDLTTKTEAIAGVEALESFSESEESEEDEESEEHEESEDELVATTLRRKTFRKVSVSRGSFSDQSERRNSKTFLEKVKSAIEGLTKKKKRRKPQQTGEKHLNEDSVGEKRKRDDSQASLQSYSGASSKTSSELTGTETCSVFVKPITDGEKDEESLEEESTLTDLIPKIELTCKPTSEIEPLETHSESKEPVDKSVVTTLGSQTEVGKEEYKSEKTEAHPSEEYRKPFSKSIESLVGESIVTDLIRNIESTYKATGQIGPLETHYEPKEPVDKPVITTLGSQTEVGKEEYKSEETETCPSEAYPKPSSKSMESLEGESTVTDLIPKIESTYKTTGQIEPLETHYEPKEPVDKLVVTTLRSQTEVGKEEYKSEKTETRSSEAFPKPFSKLTESVEVESTVTDLIIKVESTYETTEQIEPLETQPESKKIVHKDIGTTSRRQTLKKASVSPGSFSSSAVVNLKEKQKPNEDQESERKIYHTFYEKLKSAFKIITKPKLQQKTQQSGEKHLDKHRVGKSSECDVSKPSFQTGSRAKSPTPLAVSTKISYAYVEQITEGGKEKRQSVKTETRLSDASPKPFSKLTGGHEKKSIVNDLIATCETTAQEKASGTHSKSEPEDKPVVATLSRETPHKSVKIKILDEQASEHLTHPRVEEPNEPSAVTTESDFSSKSETQNEEEIQRGIAYVRKVARCMSSIDSSEFTHTACDLIVSKIQDLNLDSSDQRDNKWGSNKTKTHTNIKDLKSEQAQAVGKSEFSSTSSSEHTDEKHIQIKLDVQKKLASIPSEHLADLKRSVIATIMGVFDFIAKNPTEYIPDAAKIDTITNTLITSVECIFGGPEMQSTGSTGGAAKYPELAIPSETSSTKSCCSRCKEEGSGLSS
ncbi:histone acetyltransferase KAT6B-like [Gambusia affinis]|uniref:histone acetyltransferase KAT6B-like n=1 Tax=Gambusia affinis TaxID=33528 RepID=UPI001CDB7EA0|nr:histone acetyltransferase KAT6B-like [Gambusia affinis]